MIIYGKQPILYLFDKNPQQITKLFLSKNIDKKLFNKFRNSSINIKSIDAKNAQAMARGGNHQGFIAEIEPIELTPHQKLIKQESTENILILHSITDMGNIGAIIRTAFSLGIDGIIITGLENFSIDKVVRSSAGAVFDMPISHTKNIYDLITELKNLNYELLGTSLNGKQHSEVEFSAMRSKKALFMGSEDIGLPNRVIEKMDTNLTIKMARDFDSLNVSVASAILIDRILN
jgi:23S rRNA (guanosine2251-2'-O)-methyltransferase